MSTRAIGTVVFMEDKNEHLITHVTTTMDRRTAVLEATVEANKQFKDNNFIAIDVQTVNKKIGDNNGNE